ncbi:MAG: hypothetical protein R2825_10760 [Saprospiraceae bacterium]
MEVGQAKNDHYICLIISPQFLHHERSNTNNHSRHDDPQRPSRTSPAIRPATSSKLALNDRSNGEPLRVLTEEQKLGFLETQRVALSKNAVPRNNQATADFLWEFEEKDSSNPETWYTSAKGGNENERVGRHWHGGGLQPSTPLEQPPKCRGCTMPSWIFGDGKIVGHHPCANLNFPMRPNHEYKAFIHWD